jgi:hypothetical protein
MPSKLCPIRLPTSHAVATVKKVGRPPACGHRASTEEVADTRGTLATSELPRVGWRPGERTTPSCAISGHCSRGRATSRSLRLPPVSTTRASKRVFGGSSNVSRTALRDGIEWNLCADRAVDPVAYRQIAEAFDHGWAAAQPLTAGWVTRYEDAPGGKLCESLPARWSWSQLNPAATSCTAGARAGRPRRDAGRRTTTGPRRDGDGFGQDVARGLRHRRRPPGARAHAARALPGAPVRTARAGGDAFRCMFREAHFSWFAGERDDLRGDVVFASVQKLSTSASLRRLATELGPSVDYVVVDEVHHATARAVWADARQSRTMASLITSLSALTRCSQSLRVSAEGGWPRSAAVRTSWASSTQSSRARRSRPSVNRICRSGSDRA